MKRLKETIAAVLESWGLAMPAPQKRTRPVRQLRLLVPVRGENVPVGTLSEDGDDFVFRYSQEFIDREDLPAIPAFPSKTEEYRSRALWPFFAVRLPPTARPDVERVIRERAIDSNDEFRLLEELGRRTVSSPYVLSSA